VALEFSQDPSVKFNKGDIGYITVFVLPYDLENAAYSLSEGQHSKPINSGSGFHIFKNLKQRNAVGKIRAAQILLAFPPESTSAQQDSVKKLADSIQTALLNGADFKSLALRFSNDNLSYQNGGELPEFGVGRYEPIFESTAFSLQTDGEISKPIKTTFGYHIIKRISHTPVATAKDDKQWRDQVKQQILQNDRMEISREKLISNIQDKTNFKKLSYSKASLWRITDSILSSKEIPVQKDLNSNTGLFSFTRQTVRVKDWINYVESIKGIPSLTVGKSNPEIFKQFIETSTLDYYRNYLEDFSKDFVMELNEFKEGNLLFEVMQRKIWDAATNDSAGLQKFYKANSNKYWWENSAEAIIFTCSDQLEAEKLKGSLKTGVADWRKIVENSNGSIQADSGRFELSQIPVPDRTNFSSGLITAEVKNEADKSITFSYIIQLYNNREQRNFEDARGFVLNDYQEYLENEWVAGLKKKYPIKLNEEVFKSLPK
jgi:peptidyl-prolyl cis-trans isomerase SurA